MDFPASHPDDTRSVAEVPGQVCYPGSPHTGDVGDRSWDEQTDAGRVRSCRGPTRLTRDPDHANRGPTRLTRDPDHANRGPTRLTRDPDHANRGRTRLARDPDHTNRGRTRLARDPDHANRGRTRLARDPDHANRGRTRLARDPDHANRGRTRLARGPYLAATWSEARALVRGHSACRHPDAIGRVDVLDQLEDAGLVAEVRARLAPAVGLHIGVQTAAMTLALEAVVGDRPHIA